MAAGLDWSGRVHVPQPAFGTPVGAGGKADDEQSPMQMRALLDQKPDGAGGGHDDRHTVFAE